MKYTHVGECTGSLIVSNILSYITAEDCSSARIAYIVTPIIIKPLLQSNLSSVQNKWLQLQLGEGSSIRPVVVMTRQGVSPVSIERATIGFGLTRFYGNCCWQAVR